jgi:hypothetical protein
MVARCSRTPKGRGVSIRTPIEALRRLVASAGLDREAAAWAAHGLGAWLRCDGEISLPRCLGLHTGPRSVRIALRNQFLREAAREFGATTPWARAQKLHAAARHFEAVRWPCWRREALPPARATRVERALFLARQYAEFPRTVRQLRNILG